MASSSNRCINCFARPLLRYQLETKERKDNLTFACVSDWQIDFAQFLYADQFRLLGSKERRRL